MRRTIPVLLLLATTACSTAPQPANTNAPARAATNAPKATPPDPTVPEPFTATGLVAAHAADPAAFKQKYLGRDLEVSGVVESIVMDPKDADHVLGLRLVVDSTSGAKESLLSSFPEQKKVKKGDLKAAVGAPVKFKGAIIGNAAGLEVRITTLY